MTTRGQIAGGVDSINLAGSTGSNLVGFLQAGTGAVARTVQGKERDIVSVKDFGATGDGVTDDTAAIQAAITAVLTLRNGILFFPANVAGAYYKTTAPLTVNKSIVIRGAGPDSTRIIGVGLSAGQYVLDVDCLAVDGVEHLEISGLTLWSLDSVPNGLHIKNASYVLVKQVQFYGLATGIKIEGARTFSNFYEQATFYSIVGKSVEFAAFSGGGHHTFKDCTFTGDIGLYVDSTTTTDAIALSSCNFEACVSNSVYCAGTVRGLSFVGCRTEGNNGSVDFLIDPAVGKVVSGLIVTGCNFTADSGACYPIQLGGTGGKVRGFSITGNNVAYAAVGTYFVRLNGDGESGVIAGNYLEEATAGLVSSQRAGVAVFGNEYVSGKFAEYWGTANWGVVQGTWTATDNSGAGLSLTGGSGFYTKIGRMVFWQVNMTYPVTADATAASIAGLPYDVLAGGGSQGRSGANVNSSTQATLGALYTGGAKTIYFTNKDTNATVTNATLSGDLIYLSGHYTI